MVELRSGEQPASAVERARGDVRSLVVRAAGTSRRYKVSNREKGTQYTVFFFVSGGRRFGHCS